MSLGVRKIARVKTRGSARHPGSVMGPGSIETPRPGALGGFANELGDRTTGSNQTVGKPSRLPSRAERRAEISEAITERNWVEKRNPLRSSILGLPSVRNRYRIHRAPKPSGADPIIEPTHRVPTDAERLHAQDRGTSGCGGIAVGGLCSVGPLWPTWNAEVCSDSYGRHVGRPLHKNRECSSGGVRGGQTCPRFDLGRATGYPPRRTCRWRSGL